jgi:hypothetical protein
MNLNRPTLQLWTFRKKMPTAHLAPQTKILTLPTDKKNKWFRGTQRIRFEKAFNGELKINTSRAVWKKKYQV